MFPVIPFIYFLICGITGMILRFKMLGIIESKGNKVDYFFSKPFELRKFVRIIKEETDSGLKRKYRVLLWSQITLIPMTFIGFFLLLGITS